ncbi:unnamed protein product [Pylaiella littoralis]
MNDCSESKPSGKGMIFTFIHKNMKIRTWIANNPVFDSVEGVQENFGFLTKDMVDHMKSEVSKVHEDIDVSDYPFPIDEDSALDLVYNYTSCIKKCRRGEKSGAVMVTYIGC